MDDRLEELLDRCLLLDLETGPDGAIHKIGAVRGGETLVRQGRFDLWSALATLDAFAADAEILLGHNLLGHDLPCLRSRAPGLGLLQLPVVDSLYISPLAFPENPYHRLVKDYKLVRDGLNDPVADAKLAARVFLEQWKELRRRAVSGDTELLRLYRFCFQSAARPAVDTQVETSVLANRPDTASETNLGTNRVPLTASHGINDTGDGRGLAWVFFSLGATLPDDRTAVALLRRFWSGRTCDSASGLLALRHLADPTLRPVVAYATAWLQVAGARSVLPPWVRHRFPATTELLHALRDVPCESPDCAWCREVHDPKTQLKRWFGFDGFRPDPVAADGGSLQEAVVARGMGDQSLLAILPTGGGKSLCFQLPALVRNRRRGLLTIVVSPLQALMKDQVDNLTRNAGTGAAAALYGLLTPPERGDVLERVRLGDLAILYVSPEQLRNASLSRVLEAREIGCWVFDEAHCLSKWGHDFRPDYLYAARFIRELSKGQGQPPPPIACFTATAKKEVTAEILAHFREELNLELALFEGGVERDNLAFEVQLVRAMEKDARVHGVLTEHLADGGAGIVYASSRRRTEELAQFLHAQGWTVEAFHAGLKAPEKKRIQEAFVGGELRVICATNAFGMGVDKEDVRLVIHLDIPGSLENYVQEAGRAGRDRQPALCVLLYDEQAPDAETGDWQQLSLRRLNQHLVDQGFESNPEMLRRLLASLARDGRGLAGERGSLELRQNGLDHYRIKLHRDWRTLTATAERRQALAHLVLKTLLAKLPANAPAGADLLVSFGTDELTRAIAADMVLAGSIRDPLAAVDRGLMFLHEQGALVLQRGLAVFRQAMTVRLVPEAHRKRYSKAQHQPLAQHYGERIFQIHVMAEYARLGSEKIRQALTLVTAYFTLDKRSFVRRFFPDRREVLQRATTAESFRQIVESLGNPDQTEIVAAPEEGNRLVLAGPGSGKTRVVVHRCAYLLRVRRVDPRGILVLCYNRIAALELRRRLRALVGNDARGVTIQTYHGLAMRLTGTSFAERMERSSTEDPDFSDLIPRAVDMLEGRTELPGLEPDALRDCLLAGYRHLPAEGTCDAVARASRSLARNPGTADGGLVGRGGNGGGPGQPNPGILLRDPCGTAPRSQPG